MRRTSISLVALGFAGALAIAGASPARALVPQDPEQTPEQPFVPFTAQQLENLVAPIALYADPLLAQVLLAATFPDQIHEAAEFVRANGTGGVDDQSWDVSVRAVAHYPTVLNLLDQRSDWTTSLGQAYAAQSTDVMTAIQQLRRMARDQGNLQTTPEQQVVYEDGYVRIWPAQTRYIYVPVYDPAVIYVRPIWGLPVWRTFFSFGVGYPIGAWLIYDWDWPMRRIYYTGWWGGGWIGRSRPFIQINNIYVNPGYRRIHYDRDVLFRRPDYGRIHRYDGLYPGISYAGRPAPAPPPLRTAHPRDAGTSLPYGRSDDGRTAVRTRPGNGGATTPGARTRDDGRRWNAPTRNDASAPLPRVLPTPTRERSGSTEQPHVLPNDPGITRQREANRATGTPDAPRWQTPTVQRQNDAAATPDAPRWQAPTVERRGERAYPAPAPEQPVRESPRAYPSLPRAYPTAPRTQPTETPRNDNRWQAPERVERPDPPRYSAPRPEAPRYEAPRQEAPRYQAPRSESPRNEGTRGGGWRAAPPPDRSGPVMRSGRTSDGRSAQPRESGRGRR